MKKIALLLCAALSVSMLFTACGKDQPAPDASSSGAESSAVESMPTTEAEIIGHNDKIDPADVNLIQFNTPAAGSKIATIKTSAGDIKLVLYPEEAPKAVENFTALVEKGFYNGKTIYQAVPSVRIAMGSTDDGKSGESASGTKFEDEYSLNLWHFNGAVCMDNSGIPGENDSRFFIVTNNTEISDELLGQIVDGAFPEKVVNKYLDVGGVPNYDAKNTVFGQVIEGMDIVQKIASAETDPEHKLKEDITIQSIELGTL